MKTFGLIILFMSQMGNALPTKPSLYQVKAEFMVGGKVVSAPGFIVRKNKSVQVEQTLGRPSKKLKIELTASETSKTVKNGLIHLKLKVDFKDKSQVVHANTLADIEPGKSKIIPLTSSQGKVQLRVTADRKTL